MSSAAPDTQPPAPYKRGQAATRRKRELRSAKRAIALSLTLSDPDFDAFLESTNVGPKAFGRLKRPATPQAPGALAAYSDQPTPAADSSPSAPADHSSRGAESDPDMGSVNHSSQGVVNRRELHAHARILPSEEPFLPICGAIWRRNGRICTDPAVWSDAASAYVRCERHTGKPAPIEPSRQAKLKHGRHDGYHRRLAYQFIARAVRRMEAEVRGRLGAILVDAGEAPKYPSDARRCVPLDRCGQSGESGEAKR